LIYEYHPNNINFYVNNLDSTVNKIYKIDGKQNLFEFNSHYIKSLLIKLTVGQSYVKSNILVSNFVSYSFYEIIHLIRRIDRTKQKKKLLV
jgi:hypothetical protein